MIQSFDVQLQVALRALGEVVAPALQGAEKHVAEQLHLAMATLSFIRTRLPEARRYYRMELSSYMELATAAAELAQPCLPAESEDLVQIVSSGKAMLDDPEADIADYEAITRDLRERITQISSHAVGTPCHEALDHMILDRGGELLMQYRQWCAPFGLEPKPDELPAAKWL